MQLFLRALIIVAHTETLTLLNSLVEVTVNSKEEKLLRLLSLLRPRIRPLDKSYPQVDQGRGFWKPTTRKKPPSTHIMKQALELTSRKIYSVIWLLSFTWDKNINFLCNLEAKYNVLFQFSY
jgi:hypothetical protein